MDPNRISKNHLSFEYFLAWKFKNNNLINLITKNDIQVQQLECNHSDQNPSKKIHLQDLRRLWPSFPKNKKKETMRKLILWREGRMNENYLLKRTTTETLKTTDNCDKFGGIWGTGIWFIFQRKIKYLLN
jgi:flagellar hook protein FlgE